MKRFLFLFMAVLMMAGTAKADVEWTIWEGSIEGGNVQLSPTNFNGIEAGDKICVYGTGTLTKALTKSTGDKWEWSDISGYSATETGIDANYYYVVDDNLVELLGSDDLKAFIIRNWDNGTITKVSIKKKTSMIKTVLSDVAKSESTFEYTIPSSTLANLVEGDYLYIAARQQSKEESESYKIEFKNAANWSYYTTIYNCNHDIWWAASSDVKNNDLYIYGEHYSPTGVYLYHPVPSFSIGSIGYATFSASQEVTAPNTVTAYRATVSGSSVALTPFTDNVIPANTGAIIQGEEGTVLEFIASSTGRTETSELIACTTATNVSTLTGSDYDLYVLYAGTGESEEPLPLSDLLDEISNWGGNVTVSSTEPYTAEWTSSSSSSSMGKWLGTNWSSYDKLRLVFTENTVADNVHFGISYSGQGDTENTGAELAQNQLTVDIPLNPSYKSAIGNFSFNSNATSGKLTFASAALIDSDGATVAEFRKTTSGTLAANKAYLKLASSSPARLSIVFNDDDSETTGVLDVQKHTTQSDNVYYNLRGMQVDKPTKGLYIMNGKKVFVK